MGKSLQLIKELNIQIALFLVIVLFAIQNFVFNPKAFSQLPSAAAGGANAGTTQQQFDKQRSENNFIKMPSLEREEDVDDENLLETNKERIHIQGVTFKGNRSIHTDKLTPFTQEIVGKSVSIDEINAVVSKLKKFYRDKGFISVYIHIPPQDLSQGGNLTLYVIEGRLGEIKFAGNKHYSDKVLRAQIEADSGEPISYGNFVADLIRLNKNDNINAKATFQKGSEFGETDVVINVEDRRRFHLTGTFGNFVSDNVGGLRGGVNLDFDSPLGLMDHFSAGYQQGQGSLAFNGDYNIPINNKGTRVGTSYSHSIVDVRGPLRALNLQGRARTHTGYISHPLIEKEFLSLTGFSGFDWKNVENNVFNTTFGRENLRVIHAGVSLEKKWPKLGGVTYANASTRFGLGGILGATETGDATIRARTSNKFFVSTVGTDHYQNLGKGIIGRVRSQVQLTPDRLPTLEQSRLGGNYSIRGYQEGERLADNSMLVSSEIYFPFFLAPKKWKLPFTKKTLREQIQPFVFADYGYGRVTNPLPSEKRERNLLGVGGGARIQLYKKVFGRLEWAAPVGSSPTDTRNSSFYFNLNVEAI